MAKTILVVDDSAIAREMITFALNDEGYGVISAVHGRDALNKLSITTADLVITDLDMPVMNGTELVKQLRSSTGYAHMPIIMMISSYHEREKEEVTLAGASGCLVKPVSANYLALVINAFLRCRY